MKSWSLTKLYYYYILLTFMGAKFTYFMSLHSVFVCAVEERYKMFLHSRSITMNHEALHCYHLLYTFAANYGLHLQEPREDCFESCCWKIRRSALVLYTFPVYSVFIIFPSRQGSSGDYFDRRGRCVQATDLAQHVPFQR